MTQAINKEQLMLNEFKKLSANQVIIFIIGRSKLGKI